MGNAVSDLRDRKSWRKGGKGQTRKIRNNSNNNSHNEPYQQYPQEKHEQIFDHKHAGVGGDVGMECHVEDEDEDEAELLKLMDVSDSWPPPPQPNLASLRSMSSRRFKKDTDWSTQWKIFNALNINDDKMMLDLSAFLSKLEQGYLSKLNKPQQMTKGQQELNAAEVIEDRSPYGHALEKTPSVWSENDRPASELIGTESGNDDENNCYDGVTPEFPPTLHGVSGYSVDVFNMNEDLLEEDDAEWSTSRRYLNCPAATTLNLQDIEIMELPTSRPGLMKIGSVEIDLENTTVENLQDYNLEKETFTISTVHEVINLYTAGGQLNIKSVRRILREAYKILKSLPNINVVEMDEDTSVTIVGDLHGQLSDLLHLLSCNFPSPKNKYVFNGDFVDRGPYGVEILVILFLLMNVLPGSVFLNRGNHEDFGLCCVYGFQKECLQKYNHVVFAMFGEMFCHVPVCSIVAGKIFVVHGGLFHRPGVTLDDIAEIKREKYVIPHSREAETFMPVGDRLSDLKYIMVCALWSDPDLGPSYPTPDFNPRGAGILFGPDLMDDFLVTNDLSMVVRSHECVEEGFDLPFEGKMEHTCATVFSASNYGGSMNRGAVVKFSYKEGPKSRLAGGDSYGNAVEFPLIYYRVYSWLSCGQEDDVAFVERANKNGLSSLVLRRKRFLLEAFRQLDKTDSGYLSLEKWAMVMEHVIGLDINWCSLVDLIVDKADRRPCTDECREGMSEDINYASFLSKFHAQYQTKAMNTQTSQLIDAVYSKRELLEGIFRFFDQDSDGRITRNEFNIGCEIINVELPPKDRLTNTDAILGMMDLTSDGGICINELFEVFRLVDCSNVTD